jgi:hypothetical protein
MSANAVSHHELHHSRGRDLAVKKYVVRLSAEERAQHDELIRKGKRSAQLLTKARAERG